MAGKILITGAFGMLGHYLLGQWDRKDVITLGRSRHSDMVCDLLAGIPAFVGALEGVVHAAGSEEDAGAELNYRGTLNLINFLDTLERQPEWIVYISSHNVYGRDAGVMLDEDKPARASSGAGNSKVRAEQALYEYTRLKGIKLLILRPAYMFGKGIGGDMEKMFRSVVSGRYVHIRGNDACMSIVTAYDVARVARMLAGTEGVLNVAYEEPAAIIDLAEAMSLNAGAQKRMTTLPEAWAATIWKFFRWLPYVKEELDPEKLRSRGISFTLDTSRLRNALEKKDPEIRLFNTLDVISRREKDYDYEEQ